MIPHPDTQHHLNDLRRQELIATAARERRADQAIAGQAPDQPAPVSLKWRLGAAMVDLGRRLQGAAAPNISRGAQTAR